MKQQLLIEPQPGSARYIEEIRVRGLFGEFDYSLRLASEYGLRLGVITGANGTGKTTLLRLIHSALSRRPGRFKEVVHQTIFTSFEIFLSSGLRVGFRRTSDVAVGPFQYYAQHSRQPEISLAFPHVRDSAAVEFGIRTEDFVPQSPDEIRDVISLTELLKQFAPAVVYLPTNRDTRVGRYEGVRWAASLPAESRTGGLTEALSGFMDRLQKRARRESNDAEAAAFDVLVRTVDRVLIETPGPRSQRELIESFEEQLNRMQLYAKTGLMADLQSTELIQKLKAAPEEQFSAIASVLDPYLASQRARLDSVKDTQDLISQLINSLNEFFGPKRVTLDLLLSLRIFKQNQQLDLRTLSSGERQLLLLFTKCLALKERTLVLIDEPELSLNADWTRKLLRHLLLPTLSHDTQFVAATHSIDLVAKYSDAILDLNQ